MNLHFFISIFLLSILILESRRRVLTEKEIFNISSFLSGSISKSYDISEATRFLSQIKPEDHFVSKVPGLDSVNSSVIHYAGHLPVGDNHGQLFYWLIEAEDAEKAASLPIIGPGCSSMDGLWLELGPFRLSPDGKKVTLNKFSWHKVANLLFIDQPVGTGLSFTSSANGYAKTDNTVNEHFYHFLQQFFALHGKFTSKSSSGEVVSNSFIPNMAAHILRNNKNKNNLLRLDLKGIALGNPWLDPYNQYDVSDLAHGLGILSLGQRNKMKEQEKDCRHFLRQGKFNQNVCFSLLDKVVDAASVGSAAKLQMYDVRQFSSNTVIIIINNNNNQKAFPPGHEALERYLNRADVRDALRLHRMPKNHRYVECADPPFYALTHQDGKGATDELTAVLDSPANVRVLVFSGQFDLVCHHLGSEKSLEQLKWTGQQEYNTARRGVWVVDHKPAGYVKSSRNLQSVLVLDAGHMVPLDAPRIALDLINRFVFDKPLRDGDSSISSSTSSPLPDCVHRRVRGQKSRRGLTTSEEDLFVSVTNVIPLDRSVALRIRIHRDRDRGKQQHHRSSSPPSLLSLVLQIDPGMRQVSLDFKGTTSHLDVLVAGLQNGLDYSFSVIRPDQQTVVSKRTVTARPGCFSSSISQCCGRGECVSNHHHDEKKKKGTTTTTTCRCDAGFSGDFCDHYEVSLSNGIMSNVSNAARCPSRLFVTNLTVFFDSGRTNEEITTNLETLSSDKDNNRWKTRHHWCNSSSSSWCELSLELSLQSRPSSSNPLWMQIDKFPTYQTMLSTALMLDLQMVADAVLGAEVGIRIVRSVSMSMSTLIRRNNHSHAHTHSSSSIHTTGSLPVASAILAGNSSVVELLVHHLIRQSTDPTSLLRRGVVSCHVKPGQIIVTRSTKMRGEIAAKRTLLCSSLLLCEGETKMKYWWTTRWMLWLLLVMGLLVMVRIRFMSIMPSRGQHDKQ